MSDIYAALRERIAGPLSTAITDVLRETGHLLPPGEADSIVELINRPLAETRLAIVNPSTSLPSSLNIHRRHAGRHGLRLVDTRTPSGGAYRTLLSLSKLDLEKPLELAEKPVAELGRSR